MKQRLLLALLMLFSSVGFMKVDAQISITLPKTEKAEDVTITFKGKGFTPGDYDEGSYPYFGKDIPLPTPPTTATQVVYKFSTKTDAEQTLTLQATNAKSAWGDVQMEINGKVSQFVVTNNPDKDSKTHVLNYITSLSFTNNGELKELVLAKGQAHETTGLPNLKELSCSGNKLTWIPKKAAAMTKYEIGTQTPENIEGLIATPVNSNSKNGVTLNISKLSSNGNSTLFNSLADLYAFTIANAKDKVGKNVTTALVGVNKAVYSFKQDEIFFDGEVTFDVKVTDTNYPGVVISGVKTTISVPTFTLKTDNLKFDSKQGTINSDKKFDNSQIVKKGDKIVLTPAPEEGYEFDKFTSYKGVSEPTLDGNAYTFTVLGDVDPVIEAAFKAKGATVTYNNLSSI